MTPAIRRLTLAEMDDAAILHRAAFDDRLPWLAGRHTPREDRTYFRDHVFKSCKVEGAFSGTTLLGFIAFRDGWIDHLYISPGSQAQGTGSRLLGSVQHQQNLLKLWTFERNLIARRFYENRGFRMIDRTNGSRNEEQEPDILYEWRASN